MYHFQTKQAKEGKMKSSIYKLVESARNFQMTEPQKVEQRISFAYGTTKIENDNVTRDMVINAAQASSKQ